MAVEGMTGFNIGDEVGAIKIIQYRVLEISAGPAARY